MKPASVGFIAGYWCWWFGWLVHHNITNSAWNMASTVVSLSSNFCQCFMHCSLILLQISSGYPRVCRVLTPDQFFLLLCFTPVGGVCIVHVQPIGAESVKLGNGMLLSRNLKECSWNGEEKILFWEMVFMSYFGIWATFCGEFSWAVRDTLSCFEKKCKLHYCHLCV